MIRLLLGTLIIRLVNSCAIEDPDASGVLVDPNSDTEVPEGLTARDFDFNKDGVIDILDLVIVSKFLGQEVVDDSPDTVNATYNLPELPEFIYAKIELEQQGWYDRETRKSVIIPEYGDNLQIAMRLQVQKGDRSKAFESLIKKLMRNRGRGEISRSEAIKKYEKEYKVADPLYDRFEFYEFPDIKIISDQQKPTQKEFTFTNNLSSISGIHVGPLERSRWEGACGFTRMSQSHPAGDDGYYFKQGFFFQIFYANLIGEVQQLEDCWPFSSKGDGQMGDALHIGKEIIDKYTNTYINWINFNLKLDTADQNEKRYYTRYTFKRFGTNDPANSGALLGQFMTPSIQQQIKEEHFPEDIDE